MPLPPGAASGEIPDLSSFLEAFLFSSLRSCVTMTMVVLFPADTSVFKIER
jgi:hypothetical protein